MRPEKCIHCNKDIPYQQMEVGNIGTQVMRYYWSLLYHFKDHIQKKCPDVYHTCPNGCDKSLKMKLPEVSKCSFYKELEGYTVSACF